MNRAKCFPFALATVFGLAVLVNSPTGMAKPIYHDAKQLVPDKPDGHHDMDHHGKFTTSVEMKNGKVHALRVRHSERGDIPVKKYKTNRKMAINTNVHVVNASLAIGQTEDMGTVYIGYS